MTIISFVFGALGSVTKGLIQEFEDLEIKRRMETIQTTIIEIGQNTKKSVGGLRRLAKLKL